MIAFASSLDQGGPLARNAADLAVLLNAIVGFDARDSTSLERPKEDYARALAEPLPGASADKPLKGLRIGLPCEYFGEGMDDDVRRSVEAAIDELGTPRGDEGRESRCRTARSPFPRITLSRPRRHPRTSPASTACVMAIAPRNMRTLPTCTARRAHKDLERK